MKNRGHPFHCSIAGKTIGITLRHGGGLQEPDHVYVRCDERDCQYVDLNEPPCPLRVEMFADGSDDRVAEHLATHAGTRLCYACLTEKLGITHDQVRRASWRLKDAEGFSIRPSRCAACRRRRVTIGLGRGSVSGVAAPEPSARVPDRGPDSPVPSTETPLGTTSGAAAVGTLEPYLRSHPGYSFCAHCLARELKGEVANVRDAMWSLEPRDTFRVRTAQCVSCLMSKRVIRYEAPSGEMEAPRRIIDFLVRSASLAFCPTCVAFATEIPLSDAKRIVADLEPLDEFSRRDAACSACGRWQMVIGALGGNGADAQRAAELGEVLSGHVRHRGFRIDLLSFRTAQGWRPFALVKTGAGALVPDAPTIVLGLVPKKVEADELAATQARDWIDKRFP